MLEMNKSICYNLKKSINFFVKIHEDFGRTMVDKLPPKILVIETDEVLRTSVSNTIERYWFTVFRAGDFDTALKSSTVNKPNVVIISSRIQGLTAVEMAVKIRKLSGAANTPIVFLVDEGESIENYKAIDNGLNEYVYRPFTPNELMTAIKSLLRRSKPVFQDKIIKYKDLSMDLAKFAVYRSTRRIHLGPTEFKILQLLLQSPKSIFSRQQIIDYVWGANYSIEPRTVDVHVNRLRTLIKEPNDPMPFIKTVRAAGYCLSLPGEID
ncbi:MAG: phoB [Rickettsiaceae bacterium]|jgi:two-component system phosphate regulon response regulator PhoB|nr:phoB [Rickettsiaceae bacterium]